MTFYSVDSDKNVLIVDAQGFSINDAIHNFLKKSADQFINPKILTHHLIFIKFIERHSPEYKILPKIGVNNDMYLKDGWYLYHGTRKSMTYPISSSGSVEGDTLSKTTLENIGSFGNVNNLKSSNSDSSNDFSNFVSQCIRSNVNGKIDKVVLFNRYVLWCSTNRLIPGSSESLDINLHRNGYISTEDEWSGLSFN